MMIRFGTSGWRGLMGEEFTFHNVRVVTQAIANHLEHKFAGQPVALVVGYDTRFLSERFALEAAKLLSKNNISVFLAERVAAKYPATLDDRRFIHPRTEQKED
jgi:phosphoglucomutase